MQAKAAWLEFQREFQNALRARLPDVATLRTVLSALQPDLGQKQQARCDLNNHLSCLVIVHEL